MADSKLRSIRFPADLAKAVEDASREVGLSFNAYVIEALRSHLGQTAAEIEWLGSVRLWLLATFSETSFPPDVTRLVFHHIRDTPALWEGYLELLTNDEGQVIPQRRAHLHKEIGRMVKEALHAEVFGRAVDLDPAENLIRSHALLRPAPPAARGITTEGNEDE